MTMLHVAINAVAHLTAWLLVIAGAVWIIRNNPAGGQLRVLLLRVGLAVSPLVLALGLAGHTLPWARPLLLLPGQHEQAFSAEPMPQPHPGQVINEFIEPPAMPADAVAITTAEPPPVTPLVQAPPPAATIAAWLPWLLGAAWAIGSMIMLAQLAAGLHRLRRRRRQWNPVNDRAIGVLSRRIARKVGLNRRFMLLASSELPMPVAMGVLRPAVVIPRSQFGYLDTAEGWAVLAHELAHLRYRDPLWRLIGATVRALLWFHPLVGWLNRRAQVEAEYQCDQLALSGGANRRNYARLLVNLADLAWGDRPLGAAAIGATGQADQLEQRLKLILSRTPPGPAALGRPARAAIMALAIAMVISLGSIALLGEQMPGAIAPSANDLPVATAHGDNAHDNDITDSGGRVVIVLLDGRRVEGGWLGSTPEFISIIDTDGEKHIPFRQVAHVRMIHPDLPDHLRYTRGRGGDGERRPPDDFTKLRDQLNSATARLEDARNLPHDDPSRPTKLKSAEQDLAAAREAIEQFRRRMAARFAGVELPPHWREAARVADTHAAAGQWAEAIAAWKQIHAANPRHQHTVRQLIRGYENLGQQDKAEQMRKLLRELPDVRGGRQEPPGRPEPEYGRDARREDEPGRRDRRQ